MERLAQGTDEEGRELLVDGAVPAEATGTGKETVETVEGEAAPPPKYGD